MIGQTNLLEQVNIWYEEQSLPKFLIVNGPVGGGKKTFLSYISNKFGYPLVYFTNKVEGVRELIEVCYNQSNKIIYAIPDADIMSSQAENSLLKIAEEPPTNAYIAITASSDTLLPTIKSRGVQVNLESYTKKDKELYVKNVLNLEIDDILKEEIELSDTLYDINIFERCDFSRLKQLCQNVVKKIAKANIGSALGITSNINIKEKDSTEGFELSLFLKVLSKCFYEQYMLTRDKKYFDCYRIILNSKKQLSRSFNKLYILDELLLTLRSRCA